MKIKGWDLKFFNSGEWQVCDERLKDLEKVNRPIGVDGYCPGRENLFRVLRLIPRDSVRCCIIGQDPYPDPRYATGVAFSIPEKGGLEFPPTLRTLLEEYCKDLHLPYPSHGSLEGWCSRGVLLWNAVPSCRSGHSLSHDWPEWECLTREIVTQLSARGVVFVLLGQVARRYLDSINLTNNYVIVTSHPSPRGSRSSNTPFIGSRIFSAVNDKLNENGLEPIEWRLP